MGLNLAEALIASASDPNFLPCPSITLYANPAAASLGFCGICQVNELKLRSSAVEQQDKCPPPAAADDPSCMLAILPCGHIACAGCLQKCLQHKPHCPFCRFELTYELCSHPLQPRVITTENLLSIPDTIPMGGKMPYQCCDCRLVTNRATNESVLKSLAGGFQTLQGQYKTADERKKDAIKRKLGTMQQQFKMVAGQLSAETAESLSSQW